MTAIIGRHAHLVPKQTLRSAGQRIGWIRLAGRLAPEDGVSSVVEVVKQVLDLWAGVQRGVAVVFLVPVAPVQRP